MTDLDEPLRDASAHLANSRNADPHSISSAAPSFRPRGDDRRLWLAEKDGCTPIWRLNAAQAPV
jgi:hypothetical protein